MKDIVLKRKSILLMYIITDICLILMSGLLMIHDLEMGLIVLFAILILIGIMSFIYYTGLKKLYNDMLYNISYYRDLQQELLEEFEIPYAIIGDDLNIVWMNKAFRKIIQKDKSFHQPISEIFPILNEDTMPQKGKNAQFDIEIEDRNIKMHISSNSGIIKKNEKHSYVIYLFDETLLKESIRKLDEQKDVVGLIYIDNYEELMNSIEEVRQSLLLALVERKINKYFGEVDGIVKKIDKDKYLVLFKRLYLDTLKNVKFDILEDVKTVNIGNELAVTISIGLGLSENTLLKASDNSTMAMDLALGRGGDQCVIKSDNKITYYGGRTQSVEKNTRVKARVKAHALRELMAGKDQIIIMGHQMTDVDSFGAAIGVYRAATTINKKASIVINIVSSSLKPMIEPFLNNPMYDADMFLNSEQAINRVNNNTLVVVVDTNRPSYTECPQLLNATSHIVVFDHHRVGEDVIENAELLYIEPYASSASEMVAEVLQYFSENVKLRPVEADCIYGGIVIDTNNFTAKTGARTFDAAAYLKRCGADVIRVRKMFRDKLKEYQARAEAIRTAEVYLDSYAIGICPSDNLESPTIVGAQAANGLLDIVGIKASFIISEFQNKSFISARSIDEVNVQIIMEKLGGGGHLNIAGAQLECSASETKKTLINLLEDMNKKGEL